LKLVPSVAMSGIFFVKNEDLTRANKHLQQCPSLQENVADGNDYRSEVLLLLIYKDNELMQDAHICIRSVLHAIICIDVW